MMQRCVLLTVLVSFLVAPLTVDALPTNELPLQPVSVSVAASTGEKPQSKVWTHAGEWWSVLASSSGTWLRRLDGDTWTDILQVSGSTSATCDVKADGGVAHILVFTGTSSELVSVEYVAGTNGYQPWATRPTPAPVSLDSSVETATIDIDSAGRMWLASDASTDINVRCSNSPYSSWSAPITLGTGINTDDICVVTALPNGTVGVLWSNQATQRFGFRLHVDGADSTVWSADEVPASQSALAVGSGMADDHLNVAVASDATLYVAVKTSYDTAGYPLVALLVRRPGGTWDDLYEVDQGGTRGIVLLNEATSTVTVVYTDGGIAYRESPTSAISFGPQMTLMASGSLNNPTSTKQNISDEVVILASSGSAASGVLATDPPTLQGLAGWWPMNEGSGPVLVDASGNAGDATLFGNPTWAAGIEDLAVVLDGSGDYGLAPDADVLDLTDEITLATWIRPSAGSTRYLIKKATQGGADGYELSMSSNTKVFVRFNQASSANTYRLDTVTSYPTDGTTWMHLAATYDGAMIRMFVNGVQEDSLAAVFTIATNTQPLGIGAQSDGASAFQGAMDDARVYGRALSPAEILVLADQPPVALCQNVTVNRDSTEACLATVDPADVDNGSFDPDGGPPTLSLVPPGPFGGGITPVQLIVSDGLKADTCQATVTVNCAVASSAAGWWPMEEGSGPSILDASGNGNDGALSGTPTWGPGVQGLALQLNGSSYALVPDAPTLDLAGPITLAAWVRPNVVGTQYLVKKSIHGGTDGYELSLSANGTAFVRFNQPSSANTYRIDTVTDYPADGTTWVHLAATYDGAMIRIYFNGVAEESLSAVFTTATNSLPLGIGAQSDGGSAFNGAMDEVRVFGYALSTTEIQALMSLPDLPPVALCQNVAVMGDTGSCSVAVDPAQVDNGSYDPNGDPITLSLEPAGPYAEGGTPVLLIVSDGSSADTCAATITVTCASGPAELVGRWAMEERGGPALVDSSAYGNNASITGSPAWVCGIDHLSLDLDGSTQYALVPDAASLDITGAITLATWVKPGKAGTQYVIKKAIINGTDGYELSLSNPGTAFVRFNQVTSGNGYRLDSLSPFPNDGTTWMHLAATYDGAMIRMFVNGVQEDSLAAVFTLATNTLDLAIGAQSDGGTKFQGQVDEVRVYSGALSPTEILALATAPPANNPPVAVCQDVIVVKGPAEPCSAVVDPADVDNGSSDPDGDPITLTLVPPGPYGSGETTVQLIADDGCDTSSCYATITVDCPPPNNEELAGHWPMEEGSGPLVLDASGYGNDGGIQGAPSWVPGVSGLALALNGTSDHALVPDAPSLDLTDAITLAAWVRPEEVDTQYILKKALIGVTDGYEISLSGPGYVFVRFNQDTNGNGLRIDSVTPYPADGNTWAHVAATYDGATIRLYVDGAEEASLPAVFTIATNSLDVGIGAQSDGDRLFQGAIDDARIYGRALDPGEILTLYQQGLSTDVVAAEPAAGLCISTTIPCVTVPVVFTRSDITEARGASVTFRLSPELELCGSPASSITPGTWLENFAATFEVTDNEDNSYTVDQTILGLPCGIDTGGVLFEVQVQAGAGASADDVGTISVESVIVRDCANSPLPGSPGAAATLSIDRTPPAGIGDLTATQVKTGNLPADGTTRVALSWTPPETGTTVRVFRKGFGNYPEYDDAPGSGMVPTAPADSADAVANGWDLTAVALPGDTDETNAERDFWYFVAIATDSCGNVGGVSGPSNGALNYHLGDVAPLGPFGDNEVELLDISKLGSVYGSQEGQSLYVDSLDVGPTTDLSVDALPTTDNQIEFEDLILFALNFSNVSKPGTPLPLAAGSPEVRMATSGATAVGGTMEAVLALASHGAVQGVSVVLDWNPGVVRPLRFEEGPWIQEQAGLCVVLSPEPGTVDAASFGPTLSGEGVLATVTFQVLREGDPGLRLGDVRARDAWNRPVDVRLEATTEQIETVAPLVTQMGPGRPNPFRAGTSLALALAEEGAVKIQVYGMDGRLVRTLLDAVLPAARHEVTWDGRDDLGREVASGAYLIRMVTPARSQTRQVVRIR